MTEHLKRNKTLFGLRTHKDIRIKYDPNSRSIISVEGIDGWEGEIEISDHEVFNTPAFISIAGIPFFPAKYEFISAPIYYHTRKPPTFRIKLVGLDSVFYERAKVQTLKLSPADLLQYDRRRKRIPPQRKVMGESAREHIQSLIDKGNLTIQPGTAVTWHWCHLIAFSMLPAQKAQHKRNLVCATAACNGHMANIEAAVKLFVYETGRSVHIEVTAIYIVDTHVARRIRYRVFEPRSKMLFTEYFDALTDTLSDYGDFETIYSRLMAEYKRNLQRD